MLYITFVANAYFSSYETFSTYTYLSTQRSWGTCGNSGFLGGGALNQVTRNAKRVENQQTGTKKIYENAKNKKKSPLTAGQEQALPSVLLLATLLTASLNVADIDQFIKSLATLPTALLNVADKDKLK